MPSFAPPPAPDRARRAAAARWQRRPSPLARYALVAYLAIVVDASLYPFVGWRDLGIGPFDYLAADWPPRAWAFDVVVNAVGYLPLGLFAGLALHPRVRGIASVAVSTCLAATLSVLAEAVQTYLPTRVASKVDVASNVAGALVGALVAARVAPLLLDTGRLRMWRARWFATDASRGLVLTVVWCGALVYPDVFVFGTGGLLKVLDPERTFAFATWLGIGGDNDAVATAMHFRLAETLVAALSLVGVGLFVVQLVRPGTGWLLRVGFAGAVVAATIVVAALAHAFLYDQALPWPWLTPGARDGIAIACPTLLATVALPARARRALALAAFAGAVTLVNVFPDNPYVGVVGASWTRGKLMNFYGLASGVNLVWPFLAIVYLLRHGGGSANHRRAGSGRTASL